MWLGQEPVIGEMGGGRWMEISIESPKIESKIISGAQSSWVARAIRASFQKDQQVLGFSV